MNKKTFNSKSLRNDMTKIIRNFGIVIVELSLRSGFQGEGLW